MNHIVRLTNNKGLASAFQAGMDAALKLGVAPDLLRIGPAGFPPGGDRFRLCALRQVKRAEEANAVSLIDVGKLISANKTQRNTLTLAA